MTRLAWLLTLTTHAPASVSRFWMGIGDLAFGGVTYTGVEGPGGFLMQISVAASATDVPDERTSLVIAATTDAAREFFREDRGPMGVRVEYITSIDHGATWQSTGRVTSGRISNADYDAVQRLWAAEIETVAGTEFIKPEHWDHASQQRRFPGDLGFQFQADLASGIDIRWP